MPMPILGSSAQHARAHVRLLIAVVFGLGTAAFFPNLDFVTRGLIGWDVGLSVLLFGLWRMFAKTSLAQLKRNAAQQDQSATVILGLMIAAIAASLAGVVGELRNARHAANGAAALFVLLSVATLVLSWLSMQVLFAIHYTHRYYGDRPEDDCTGLVFPETPASPDYSDFLYFALCIGMTYQVSDITTRNRAFRHLVAFHAAMSFFFNTFVLALAVNLFSGLGSIS